MEPPSEGQTTSEQLVGQGSINYINKFGLHNIELLALVEARDNKSNGLSAYGKDSHLISCLNLICKTLFKIL